MKVKKAFQWRRRFSAIPGPIDIPAGAPVHKSKGLFWLVPSFFDAKSQSVEHSDAEHYGCEVAPDNVVED